MSIELNPNEEEKVIELAILSRAMRNHPEFSWLEKVIWAQTEGYSMEEINVVRLALVVDAINRAEEAFLCQGNRRN